MLKAKIKNLGPIREADIALNDLTIIAGKNNSGKTYISYALYGFLNRFRSNRSFFFKSDIMINLQNSLQLEKVAENLINEGISTTSLQKDELERIKSKVLEKISKDYSSKIHDSFRVSKDYFKNISIDISNDVSNSIDRQIKFSLGNGDSIKGSVSVQYENNQLIFKLQTIQKIPKIPKHTLANLVGSVFVDSFLPNRRIFIHSAERFGISLFYKDLDFARNRMVEMLQKMEDNKKSELFPFEFLDKFSSRYADAIQDNINYIRNLDDLTNKQSDFGELANFIKDMMDANYKATATGLHLVSKKRGENKFNIPLHLASSSARGLVGLYFYFKHQAKKGDWLIIDEPESHFNPEHQIQIARLLVICVNKGIKVLVTTHSDYFIREINNLIMLNQNFDDKQGFLKDYREYNQTMCLSEEKVNGYICENGTLRECQKDKFGIEMDNFDEVIIKSSKISRRLKATITNGDDE